MKIRSVIAACVIATGVVASSQAGAFWGIDDERPPPNGANGLSANGFSLNGVTAHVSGFSAAVLPNGQVVNLK